MLHNMHVLIVAGDHLMINHFENVEYNKLFLIWSGYLISIYKIKRALNGCLAHS